MNNDEKILIIIIGILLIGWSVWYWTFYPRNYSGEQIQKRCDEETRKSRYCIGFAEGYEWAWVQMRLDKALQELK